jgi:hypothetical protein
LVAFTFKPQDAALICNAYGAGLVEMSDGRAAMVNNFVKSESLHWLA